MLKLVFPENDVRSCGKPFNEKRPWLCQNARCFVVPHDWYYIVKVQFVNAPKGDFDLVSPEFLKERK